MNSNTNYTFLNNAYEEIFSLTVLIICKAGRKMCVAHKKINLYDLTYN